MSVCDSQADFNQAFKKALDDYNGKNVKGYNTGMAVAAVIYLLLLVWAVVIAMKIPDRDHRTLHIFFAIMCPPLYIISHFI